MAVPRRFQIPTLTEMEDGDTNSLTDVEPAFKKFKDTTSDAKKSHPSASQSATLEGRTCASTTQSTSNLSTHEKRTQEISNEGKLLQSSVAEIDNGNKVPDSSTATDGVQFTSGGADNSKSGLASNKLGSSNCLIVNPRQRGNPILKSVRNIPWEYGNIVPDYLMGQSNCALFLSLRYHQLHPNYIHDRLKLLGHSYDLRVILVQVDVKEPHLILKELAKICILADCTMILAFSPEEAGRYLETYKIFENKPPEAIMEKTEDNFMAKFTDCMTRVKSVNKTDCSTLLTAFGSLANVIDANEEDLSLCPGFGPQKAKRLHTLFHEPFLRNPSAGKRKDTELSSETQASSSTL